MEEGAVKGFGFVGMDNGHTHCRLARHLRVGAAGAQIQIRGGRLQDGFGEKKGHAIFFRQSSDNSVILISILLNSLCEVA